MKPLFVFHLDDHGLYMATMAELPILTKTLNSFLKGPTTPLPFHSSTGYGSSNMILTELRMCLLIVEQSLAVNLLTSEPLYISFVQNLHFSFENGLQLHASA